MKVLVVDVGGTHVKILVTGQDKPREFASGPTLTGLQMVAGVRKLARGWQYDAVALGYPGVAADDRPLAEPHNLAVGWVALDYTASFGCPVKIINDAAMQALGSYKGQRLLFLGLGTGLGSALVVEGVLVPMELGRLPYRKATFEDYVGARALELSGRTRWREQVGAVVALLVAAFRPDDVVLGGGNVKQLDVLPPGCRPGNNDNAFVGGFRMWANAVPVKTVRAATKRSRRPSRVAPGTE